MRRGSLLEPRRAQAQAGKGHLGAQYRFLARSGRDILGACSTFRASTPARMKPRNLRLPHRRTAQAARRSNSRRWRARRGLELHSCRRRSRSAPTASCCAASCRTSSPTPSNIPRSGRVLVALPAARRASSASRCIDTGIGIPDSTSANRSSASSTRLERRMRGGAGAGLRPVDRRPHRAGAEASHRLRSSGKGTRFSVILPVSRRDRSRGIARVTPQARADAG